MAAPSSGSGGGGKNVRAFGHFANGAAASSLFDAAFSSKPVVLRGPRAEATSASSDEVKDSAALPSVPEASSSLKRRSPGTQVFSPPVSLPESTSSAEQCNDEHAEDESDEEPVTGKDSDSSQRESQGSLTSCLDRTTLLGSPVKAAALSSAYDFDIEDDQASPLPKKCKPDPADEQKKSALPKRKPIYHHKWTTEEEDEKPSSSSLSSSAAVPASTSASKLPSRPAVPPAKSRVSNIKEPHECLESGEHDDLKDDLEYILSALSTSGTPNLKTLSCTSLARKCTSARFRHFIRSENLMGAIFKTLGDASCDPKLALSASAVFYLLCRDSVSVSLDSSTIRLFSHLLRLERPETKDEDMEKHLDTVWEVFSAYLDKTEASGKKIIFHITKDELSASSLVLEALVFILTHSKEAELKTELLNVGILQWVVSKVEVLLTVMAKKETTDEESERILVPLERCFRVLELSTIYHKKNQAFLISHRGSLLISACCKHLSAVYCRVSSPSCPLSLARQLMYSLSLTARVLTNLSYENELCCTKLGQTADFLPLALSSFTFLAPKFADNEKRFDVTLLMSSLLVNLVERCNANRRKLIDTTVRVYSRASGCESEQSALVALANMFVEHEKAARESDDGLDQELCIEEPVDEEANSGDEDDDDDVRADGRLERGKLGEMKEGEVLDQLRGIINKASTHMEDSVVASHLALLVGCILQQNEACARGVKEVLPDGKMKAMAEQLQRYIDFLRIAGASPGQFRSMERIIDVLEHSDS